MVDYLIPNETQFNVLFPGERIEDVLKRYLNKFIITLGSEGAVFNNGEAIQEVPAVEVAEIFDTTWAGDAFNGALAFSLASGEMLIERVCFANLVGSLSITKKGSQAGMSTLEMMEAHET
ncbi:PfkB family carbohydrate kinase [Ruoffia halotolerans]|uniref:PfkB family carbohydrate kinase n=1 Tax=Ruoffia halotolerans TaxID=2748684 RepID=UPI002E28D187|nr:PfkB family carbohydrate kinase [Ruoffia halotolerans]